MTWLKKYRKPIFYSALIILGILISSLFKCEKEDSVSRDFRHTDTIYVPVPYKLPVIAEKEIPKTVKKYKQDTTIRKKVEKEKIVTGTEIKKERLEVTDIDTSGKIETKVYDLPAGAEAKIDNQGNVEIKENKKQERKEKRARVGRKVLFVAFLVIGFIIGKGI